MIKKDLDIKSLIRGSVLKAQRDHGLLKEAEEEPAQPANIKRQREPFDPEKHMPKIQISSKTWGQKGSLDAKELDRYIQPITQGSGDFKTFLKNFNAALGITYGNSKTPVYTFISKDDMTLQKVVSSLVLRQLMASIVVKNSAKSAGDIWEGFFARVVEGSLPKDSPIQDIREPDSSGNFISLKLIAHNGDIDFSPLNLAQGIAKASDVKIFDAQPDLDVDDVLNRGVKYIIGEKLETNENVIAIKFYSFIINRSNFFQAVLANPKPSVQEIYAVIKSLTSINIAEFAQDEVGGQSDQRGDTLKEEKEEKESSYTKEKYHSFIMDYLYPVIEIGKDGKNIRAFLANSDVDYRDAYRDAISDSLKKLLANEYSRSALLQILGRSEKKDSSEFNEILASLTGFPSEIKQYLGPSKDIERLKRKIKKAEKKKNKLEIEKLNKELEELKSGPNALELKEPTNVLQTNILQLLNYGYNPETLQQERGFDDKDELRQYLLKVYPRLGQDMAKNKDKIEAYLQQSPGESQEITVFREKLKKGLAAEKQLARELIGALVNIIDNLYGDFLNEFKIKQEQDVEGSIEHTGQFLQNAPSEIIRDMTNLFWDFLASNKYDQLEEAKKTQEDKQNTNKISLSTKLNTEKFLRSNLASIDESYDPIYLDTKELFISTTKTLDIFREYAEDIYRDRYEMDTAIEKYFIDDEPSGMTELEITLNNMGDHVNELREKTGGEFIKPSEIKPKKDVKTARESLNRNPIDDILDLL